VQPAEINVPSDIPLKVFLFVGENQRNLSIDLASSLQTLGGNAEYIRIEGNGKNALDFHIAFWIGKLSEKDPNSYFHIISKDKGFDPLIKHLRKKNILSQRVSMISDIQILSGQRNETLPERVKSIAKSLRARGTSRPRKRRTLKNTISAFFMKTLSDHEIEEIISNLEKKGYIKFNEDVVSYNLQSVNPPEVATP
jgi:hypothetical protein